MVGLIHILFDFIKLCKFTSTLIVRGPQPMLSFPLSFSSSLLFVFFQNTSVTRPTPQCHSGKGTKKSYLSLD